MRYLQLGSLPAFFLLIPGLGYRFGADPRKGIESDEFQRRSRVA
jgi:hypothetical protein